MQGQSNFTIDARGATFVTDDEISLSSIFPFDQDSHFRVLGGKFQGSRANLPVTVENSPFAFTNDVDFDVDGPWIASGYYANGVAFVGDWLVDGIIHNPRLDNVGQCSDLAFLLHVTIETVSATGADNTNSGGPGVKCHTIIQDAPNASTNTTGVPFSETNGVNYRRNRTTNFNTGDYFTSGNGLHFSDNDWISNPGSGSSAELGLFFSIHASDDRYQRHDCCQRIPQHGSATV